MWLSKETRILVLLEHCKEFLNTANLWIWLISLPFKVCAHPVYFPNILCLYIGSLCHRLFNLTFRILPERTNLKYLYALPLHPKAESDLVPNVSWRSMPLDEVTDKLLTPFPFKITKCHNTPDNGGLPAHNSPKHPESGYGI